MHGSSDYTRQKVKCDVIQKLQGNLFPFPLSTIINNMHKSCANFMLMELIPESQIHLVTPSNNYMTYYTEELAGVNNLFSA